jgi:hypothetical protein
VIHPSRLGFGSGGRFPLALTTVSVPMHDRKENIMPMTNNVTCPACKYTQVAAQVCCECRFSLFDVCPDMFPAAPINRPQVPENIADLTGEEHEALAKALNEYEASIMTDAHKAFARLVRQNALGLLTATDLWAETVMLVLGTDPDALFPPAPEITKTLVGHGPTSTYRMTDEAGNFLGFTARP